MTPRVVFQLLEAHGYVLDRVRGSHHIYVHPDSGRRVVVPLHKRDMPAGTAMSILKQAGTERSEITGE